MVLQSFQYIKSSVLVRTLLELEPDHPEPEPMVQFEVRHIASTEPKVWF
jgi:hypothetical protein